MKALVASGLGEIHLEDVDEPVIGPSQVLVQSKVTAISAGTERRMLFGRPGDIREHAPDFPIVGGFGYLGAGVVVEVGSDVEGISPGDRVSAGRAWGAHRELLDTEASSVIRIPDSMSYLEAAASYWAVPPLAGIFATEPRLYSNAAVIGLGPLGLAGIQVLARSSRRVLGIDLIQSRIDKANDYGAIGVDAASGDLDRVIAKEMPDGADVVIEASGTQPGLELALEIAAPLGRVALVGVPPPLEGVNLFWPMQHKGVKLVPLARESTQSPQGGGAGSPRATYLPDVLDMIDRGHLDIEGMTSFVVPVGHGKDLFTALHTKPDQVLGAAIAWDPEEERDVTTFETLLD